MKTFSSQGIQLTAGQKRRQQFEKQASSAFINPILAQQTMESIQAAAKVEPRRPEKIWFVECNVKGTISVAPYFGPDWNKPAVLGYFDRYGNYYPERP